MPVTEEELKTIFASSCIESAARAIGCPASEMYLRMKRINLIENYIWEFYDVLHTQSRVYVTEDMVGHKLGEFVATRTYRGHGTDEKKSGVG